jgi:hypothetical protein
MDVSFKLLKEYTSLLGDANEDATKRCRYPHV